MIIFYEKHVIRKLILRDTTILRIYALFCVSYQYKKNIPITEPFRKVLKLQDLKDKYGKDYFQLNKYHDF